MRLTDVTKKPMASRESATHMVTFAAAGLWQQVPFDNEEEALTFYRSDYLNEPNWGRAPKLWKLVEPNG